MAGPLDDYEARKARVLSRVRPADDYEARKARVLAKRKSPEQEAVDATAEAMRQMRAGAAISAANQTIGEAEGSAAAGMRPATNLEKRAMAVARENIEQGDSPYDTATVPVAQTREDLQRVVDQRGAKIAYVGGTLQAQDKQTGQPYAQLAQNANVSLKDWWDAPAGQKVAQTFTGAFHPVSLAVGAAGGALAGKDTPPGYGAREGFMDLSAQAGRAAPGATVAASGMAAAPAAAVNLLGTGFNRLQELAAKGPGLASMPAGVRETVVREQQQDAGEWRKDYEARKAEVLRGLEAMQGARVTEQEGESVGRNVLGVQGANIASVFDPTTPLAGAMKGASAAVRAAAQNPTARSMAGEVAQTLAQAGQDPTARSFVSNVPAAVGAPLPVRGVLKGADAMAREFANVEAARVMDALADPRFTPEVRRMATDVWHDQGLRASAAAQNPVVGDLLDAAQREHFAQYVKWVRGKGLNPELEAKAIRDYNPLHLYYGQDFSQPAVRMRNAAASAGPEVEARAAELMRKAGVKPGESRQMRDAIDPFIEADVQAPGIRALYGDAPTRSMLTEAAQQAKEAGLPWGTPVAQPGRQLGTGGDAVGELVKETPARFAPGTRVRSSLEQTRADRAKFMAAEDVAARQSMNPLSRYANRVRGNLMDESDMLDDLEEMGRHDVVSGLVESTRKVARRNPQRLQQAMQKVLNDEDTLKVYRGVYGDDVGSSAAEWVAARTGGAEADDLLKHIGGYGDPLKGPSNIRIPDNVAEELRRRDLVIVRPRKVIDPNTNEAVERFGYWADNAYNRVGHTVDIPGIAAPVIMPKRAALAALQIASGGVETRAMSAAKAMDRIFGSALANTAVTRANPGFQARNIQSEGLRALMDDPRIFKEGVKESMDALAEPATRYRAMELLGVGKDMGSRLDVFESVPRASSILPSGARRAATKAADVMAAPGVATNQAFDDAVVSATFGKQQAGWGFTDLLRFHHWHKQVRNGVDPDVAALWTNQLFINYADKSAAESLGRSVMPFLRFYTGAAQGALGLALRHPERFRHLYSVANMVRAQDERDGTAVNAKSRTAVDLFTGIPSMSDPDDERRGMALRMETPLTESLAVYKAAADFAGISSPDNQRGGSLMGPGLTNMMKWAAPATVERLTGYAPMNMPPDLREAYGSAPGLEGTIPGIAAQAWEDVALDPNIAQAIGRNPRASVVWDTVRTAPFIGTAIPPYMDPLMRQYTGATGFSGRTPERSDEALRRLLVKGSSGFRGDTFDVLGSAARKRQRELKTGVDIQRKNAPWGQGGGG